MNFKKTIVSFLIFTLILVTAKAALADVMITEIMADPVAVLDGNGEYVELYNSGPSSIDLNNWTFSDNGSNSHKITTSLSIPSQSYLVLCNNDNSSTNGGFNCDYKYTGFVLSNSDDEVILTNSSGSEADRVEYDTTKGFPVSSGASMELIDLTSDNSLAASWKVAVKTFGDGDKGTPGTIRNSLPIINKIYLNDKEITTSTIDAVEGIDYVLKVNITDSDNDDSDLKLDYTKTTAEGKSLTSSIFQYWGLSTKNKEFSFTANEEEKIEMSLVATDGESDSQSKNFTLNMKSALAVAVKEVTINNIALDNFSKGNVSPGDEVKVRYTTTNNYNKVLGNIDLTMEVYSNYGYNVADMEDTLFQLLPNQVIEDEFTFTIPLNIDGTSLNIYLEAKYDEYWIFNIFDDKTSLNYDIVRKDVQVSLDKASLIDGNLTCTKNTDLVLEYTNSGDNSVTPTILVYNEKPKLDSFNKKTGEFDLFEKTPTLIINEKGSVSSSNGKDFTTTVNVNGSKLSNGASKLYVYIASPYLENGFIAYKEPLNMKTGSCILTEEVEEALMSNKNSNISTSINFFDTDDDGNYLYIDEDMDYESSLFFDVDGESNLNLLSCSTDSNGEVLTCSKPTAGLSGTAGLLMLIEESSTTSSFNEEVDVVVGNTIGVSAVYVNNDFILNKGESELLLPLEEFEVKVTVTNHLPTPVTNVFVGLSGSLLGNIASESEFNLQAGESKDITLKATIPQDTTSGKFPVQIDAFGKDFNDNTIQLSGSYSISLLVQQQAADLLLVDVSMDHNDVQCEPTTEITAEFTNVGLNNEDITLVVKNNGKEIAKKTGLTINKNGETKNFSITIETKNLTMGDNDLVLEAAYHGTEKIQETLETITRTSCIKSVDPEIATWSQADGDTVDKPFTVTLHDDTYNSNVIWYVDDVKHPIGNVFPYSESELGTYKIHAEINGEKTEEWEITISDKPISDYLTQNIPDTVNEDDLSSFEGYTVSNSYGKIVFNGPVDLTKILDLDAAIEISENLVHVDTTQGIVNAGLNVPATITLKKSFSNPVVLTSNDGTTFTLCPTTGADKCEVKNSGNEVTFTVEHFSYYKLAANQPKGLSVTAPNFNKVERGKDVTLDLVIKNLGGFESLKDVKVTLEDVSNVYVAKLNGLDSLSYTEIKANGQEAVKLTLKVQDKEATGSHSIGKLKVTSLTKTFTQDIILQPRENIIISKIEINGKTSGDLSIKETNEIEVEVENDYTQDMEDVEILVEILDVDGEDLDEEADRFDLDKGDNDKESVEFDLSDEELDEEEYTIRVTVTAESTDGKSHETIEEFKVDLDIENHEVMIEQAELSPSIAQCNQQVSLSVDVKNIGKKNEDNVELRVKNSALGIDATKSGIDLDKFSRNGNTDRITFSLNVINADAGSYPLEVELYRDGDKDDSETTTLTVKDCFVTKQAEQQEQLAVNNAKDTLQTQLLQGISTYQESGSSVKASFRGSQTYTLMLGALVFLVLIAMMMGLATLAIKKR